jgi:hypothetical protein
MIEIHLATTQFVFLLVLGVVAVGVLFIVVSDIAKLVTMAKWRNRVLQNIANEILRLRVPPTDKKKREEKK